MLFCLYTKVSKNRQRWKVENEVGLFLIAILFYSFWLLYILFIYQKTWSPLTLYSFNLSFYFVFCAGKEPDSRFEQWEVLQPVEIKILVNIFSPQKGSGQWPWEIRIDYCCHTKVCYVFLENYVPWIFSTAWGSRQPKKISRSWSYRDSS